MKIVLADGVFNRLNWKRLEFVVKHNLNWLYSFYYTTKPAFSLLRELNFGTKCYLDSGVYTARKNNKLIKLDELIEFYKLYPDLIQWVFNLDQGTTDGQIKNLQKMTNEGIPTIGIWHGSDHKNNNIGVMPLHYIEKIAEITDYIAVGNGGDRYMDTFFEYIYRKNLNVKVHLLGYIAPKYLMKYPVYSADSSTLTMLAGFGKIVTFNKEKFKLVNIHTKNELKQSLKENINNIDLIGNTLLIAIDRYNFSMGEIKKYQNFLNELWNLKLNFKKD